MFIELLAIGIVASLGLALVGAVARVADALQKIANVYTVGAAVNLSDTNLTEAMIEFQRQVARAEETVAR